MRDSIRSTGIIACVFGISLRCEACNRPGFYNSTTTRATAGNVCVILSFRGRRGHWALNIGGCRRHCCLCLRPDLLPCEPSRRVIRAGDLNDMCHVSGVRQTGKREWDSGWVAQTLPFMSATRRNRISNSTTASRRAAPASWITLSRPPGSFSCFPA